MKQLTKTKLMDDLLQKKIGSSQRPTGVSSNRIIDRFLHFSSPHSGSTIETDSTSTQRQLSTSQIHDMSPASEQEVPIESFPMFIEY